MIIILFFLFSMSSIRCVEKYNNRPWTELYSKTFSKRERTTIHKEKKEILFCKKQVKPFTQLLFSWNALRPEIGQFSFYVQVRNKRTKQWGVWHRMSEWGRGVQRSYASKSDGFSLFAHVRLEVEKGMEGDAFRVLVKAEQGASLCHMHALFVALAHFEYFKTESYATSINDLASVFIHNVPSIAQFALDHQDNGRICSPASCAMLMGYISGKTIDPLKFAQNVYDNGLSIYGSWSFNSAHAFEYSSGKVYCFVRRLNSFRDLHKRLRQKLPVIVSVRGELPGAYKDFPHGHLLVVVGWDADMQEVICQDPAADCYSGVLKRYKVGHFLRSWERSHRLAYVVEPLNG